MAEAGEHAEVPHALRRLADAWNYASADIRNRVAPAEDFAVLIATPRCEIPWWDPLRLVAGSSSSTAAI